MRKTEVSGIYKTDEGALINIDNASLKAYKKKKKSLNKIDDMEQDLAQLKDDMTEIKELLQKLIGK